MPITIKIGALEGTLPSASLSSLLDQPELKHSGAAQPLPSDLYVVISLWADNKPLVPAVQTAHRSFKSRSSISWAESVTLPIKYRDLPLSAQLAITVYDIAGPLTKTVVGGSTLRLFGKKATLKKGNQRLFLWAGRHADGRVETETPSKVGLKDEMGRLEKLVKQHERGDITRMDWLDKLAFRQIEHVHASAAQKSTNLFLYVDLPRFDWPVVFSEVVSSWSCFYVERRQFRLTGHPVICHSGVPAPDARVPHASHDAPNQPGRRRHRTLTLVQLASL